jgi:hypothetical protein
MLLSNRIFNHTGIYLSGYFQVIKNNIVNKVPTANCLKPIWVGFIPVSGRMIEPQTE